MSAAVQNLKFPLNLMSPGIRPYAELMRVEKPTGTLLMYWPFVWGLTMGAYKTGLPLTEYGVLLVRYLFAAFIIRSSACTINDIFDRKVDAQVERSKVRPLPSGRVSYPQAVLFYLAQLAVGLYSFSGLNKLAFTVGAIQLVPLFYLYPLMKRITYWPQAWLGFAMNFGFMVGWASVVGSLDSRVWVYMLAGTWCWTMLYDTIYACQDRRDDVKAGVKSTAVLFGDYVWHMVGVCAVGFVAMLIYAGIDNQQGTAYYTIAVMGTVLHLIWQYFTTDLEIPKTCWRNFERNGHLGWIIWAGMMYEYVNKLSNNGAAVPLHIA